MKYLLAVIITIFLVSCAHHHKTPEHHHAYDKQCAFSVAHGDVKVAGKDEFKYEHSGKIYYFSSEKKLNIFKKDIEENVKKANKSWAERGGARGRP